jgi:hypothetical protein
MAVSSARQWSCPPSGGRRPNEASAIEARDRNSTNGRDVRVNRAFDRQQVAELLAALELPAGGTWLDKPCRFSKTIQSF